MPSYVSATVLAAANSAMDNIFDTFKRTLPVRFYKIQNEVIVSEDPDYMPDFDRLPSYSGITETGNYQDFDARIIYLTKVDNPSFVPGGDDLTVKARQNYSKIKMQIKASGSGYSWLKDAERFTFNNEKYQIDEGWRGIGMFGDINYYSVVLSKVV